MSEPLIEDVSFIAQRLRELATENTPLRDRLDTLDGDALDHLGGIEDVPRVLGEYDSTYRHRLKCIIANRNNENGAKWF